MNQFHHEIHNFPSKLSQEFLEKIFILNQENTPEVGSLSSIEYLRQLIQLSSYQFYVIKEDEIIGFTICFKVSIIKSFCFFIVLFDTANSLYLTIK